MVVSIKAEASNDVRSETAPLSPLLAAGRTNFVVHKHLIPSDVIHAMCSMQLETVAEIRLADEDPDIVGSMSPPNVLGLPMINQDPTGDWSYQFQTLTVYFDGNNFDGVQNANAFEEARLCECEKDANAFGVYQRVVRDHALNANGQERQLDLDNIRNYLQDAEGIPMFEAGNARVEAEYLQLQLAKLSVMAANLGWVRLLDATLFTYAKGAINFSQRCPILRHIELTYSIPRGLPRLHDFMTACHSLTGQTHNTLSELIEVSLKCPDILHRVMARQDAQTGILSPLLWSTTRYYSNGIERPLIG
ncbi:hypothetical protein ColTof4_11857 [Colletotrichum tofieldiae]|nr:hypothetical protein ColTof3_03069 [Colletotrichum tofieldiae]GKT79434.1 hypothetical protein ColTof4_11857 [Colletotrichum tofieldiae]